MHHLQLPHGDHPKYLACGRSRMKCRSGGTLSSLNASATQLYVYRRVLCWRYILHHHIVENKNHTHIPSQSTHPHWLPLCLSIPKLVASFQLSMDVDNIPVPHLRVQKMVHWISHPNHQYRSNVLGSQAYILSRNLEKPFAIPTHLPGGDLPRLPVESASLGMAPNQISEGLATKAELTCSMVFEWLL